MKYLTLLLMSLMPVSAMASEVVTLNDGRKVQINNDFTWQYVTEDKNIHSPENNSQTVPVIPEKQFTSKTATLIKVGSKKNTLQVSDSGIDVLIGSPEYKSGSLILPTSVTNQSSSDVISVELNLVIYRQNGEKLIEDEVIVWRSIKRMADTYLRPKSSRSGKDIKIALPESSHYLINASVSEVESR